MTRQEQFLWVVQSMVLANVTRLASVAAERAKYTNELSAYGAFVAIDEALRASMRIPDNVSVTDAAHDFCSYIMQNLRDEQEAASGEPMQAPQWMLR